MSERVPVNKPRSENSGLARKSLSGLAWSYGGSVVRGLSGFIFGLILARLLGPEPFGIVAVALVLVGLGNLIVDSGFAAALVQRNDISDRDIRFVFSIQVSLAVLLCAVVFTLAPWIASGFRQPDAADVIRALSLMIVFKGFSQVGSSLLKRNLRFREIQIGQISSYLISFPLVGVPLAVMGYGVWSLVAAQLLQSILFALYVYSRTKHSTRPLFTGRQEITSFGMRVFGSNTSSWLIHNLDTVTIGYFFSAGVLGLYNRALALVCTPITAFISTLQSVLFPMYARMQNETEKVSRIYLASLSVIALLTFPAFTFAAACSEPVIEVLYGKAWIAAAPFLVPLALSMPLHALLAMVGPMTTGLGRADIELKAQLWALIALPVCLFVAVRYSPAWVAWSVFAAYGIRLLVLLGAGARLLHIRLTSIGRTLAIPVLLSLFIFLTLVFLNGAVPVRVHAKPVIWLIIDLFAIGLILLAAGPLVRRRIVTSELQWLIERIPVQLPPAVRRYLFKVQPYEAVGKLGG